MILALAAVLVLLRLLFSAGEVYFERDWPRRTWRGLLLALCVFALCASAFGQEVRMDIPLQTSGPNIPAGPGALAQTLWLSGPTVYVCPHVEPYSSQSLANCEANPLTTYTSATGATTCPSSTPFTQLPGTTCTSSTTVTGNLGIWYQGGNFDYYVVASYGTFGPFTANGGAGGSGCTVNAAANQIVVNNGINGCGATPATADSSGNVVIPATGTLDIAGTVLTASNLTELTIQMAKLSSGTPGTILISGTVTLTGNVVVPSYIAIEPKVQIAFDLGNYNINFNGPFSTNVFGVIKQDGTGRAYFAQTGSIAEAYPDWWITTSPDSTSTVNAALQSIVPLAGTQNGTILLGCMPNETYVTDPVIVSYDSATGPAWGAGSGAISDIPAGIDCHNATWQTPVGYSGPALAELSMYRITLGNQMFLTQGLTLDANGIVNHGLYALGNPGNLDRVTTINALLDGFMAATGTGGFGTYYTTWKNLASRHNMRHGFYFDGGTLGTLLMNNVKIDHPVSQNNCGNGYELSTAQVTMSAPEAEDNDGVGANVRGSWTGAMFEHIWFEANQVGAATGVTCPMPTTYSNTIPGSAPYTLQVPASQFTTVPLSVEVSGTTYLTLASAATTGTYTYTPEGLFTFNSAQAGDAVAITFATRVSHVDSGISASGEATDQGTATVAQGENGIYAGGRSGYTLPWTTWTPNTEYMAKQYVIPYANASCAATDRYCFQAWNTNTTYAAGDVVLPKVNFVGNARYYIAGAPCTSSTAEPLWPTQEGQTVTDTGGCVWTAHAVAFSVLAGPHNGISGGTAPTWTYVATGTVVDGSNNLEWTVTSTDILTGSVGNRIDFTPGNGLAVPSGYTRGPGGDIQATSITTLNPLPGYVGFLTYAGGSTPSATCSAFVNKGAIAINATPVAYQCSNATGSYAWNALNNPYTGLSALVSATTISSASFITTGLVMPSVPASTTAKGHCYLTWEQATAAATVSFGAGMSHAPTDLFITSNINDAATGASNVAYNTQTATSATIIGAATTPGVLGTPYYADFNFVLQTTSSNPVVLTFYGLTSNTADALVIEPGSYCSWLP